MLEVPVDNARAVEVANPTDQVGSDCFRELSVFRGIVWGSESKRAVEPVIILLGGLRQGVCDTMVWCQDWTRLGSSQC